MKRVLIADTLSRGWQSVFADAPDVRVDVRTGLSPEALAREIGAFDGLIVRSETHVTREGPGRGAPAPRHRSRGSRRGQH